MSSRGRRTRTIKSTFGDVVGGGPLKSGESFSRVTSSSCVSTAGGCGVSAIVFELECAVR